MRNFLSKAKPISSDDIAFSGLRSIPSVLRKLYEVLHGRSREAVHNCSGVPVTLEGALIRHGSSAYGLVVRFGGQIVRTEITVSGFDPVLKQLPIEHYGKSPAEIEAERCRRELETMTDEERQRVFIADCERAGVKAEPVRSPGIRPVRNHPGVSIT